MLSLPSMSPAEAVQFDPRQVRRRVDAAQRRALRRAVTIAAGLMAALMAVDLAANLLVGTRGITELAPYTLTAVAITAGAALLAHRGTFRPEPLGLTSVIAVFGVALLGEALTPDGQMLGTAQLAIILVGVGLFLPWRQPWHLAALVIFDRARGDLRAQPTRRGAPGQRRGQPDRGGPHGRGDEPHRPPAVAGQGARDARAAVHAAPVEPLRAPPGDERHRAEPRADPGRPSRRAHGSWESAGVQRGDCPHARPRRRDAPSAARADPLRPRPLQAVQRRARAPGRRCRTRAHRRDPAARDPRAATSHSDTAAKSSCSSLPTST